MDKLVAAIAEVEGLADSLQQTRAELVEVDKRRQGLRESTRALKRQVQEAACDLPVWMELPESKRVEQIAEELSQRQKRIVGQITEKNGTPQGCSEQMVKAFLELNA